MRGDGTHPMTRVERGDAPAGDDQREALDAFERITEERETFKDRVTVRTYLLARPSAPTITTEQVGAAVVSTGLSEYIGASDTLALLAALGIEVTP